MNHFNFFCKFSFFNNSIIEPIKLPKLLLLSSAFCLFIPITFILPSINNGIPDDPFLEFDK